MGKDWVDFADIGESRVGQRIARIAIRSGAIR